MTTIFLFLAAFLTFGGHRTDLASSSPGVCEYVPKARSHGLMSALPIEAVGFIDCFTHHPETNSIIVARFAKLDERTLIDYVTKVGRKTDLTSQSSHVSWESRQEISSRQLMLKTVSPAQEQRPEQIMAHYAFVTKSPNGGYLVFIHTASETQTHRIRHVLMTVNHELENQALLRQIL